jgi:hypothetical protein
MRLLRFILREFGNDLRRRAERRRMFAWGRQEELRRDRLPEAYVKQQTELDLALAGFTDGLGQACDDALAGAERLSRVIRTAAWRP